MYSYLSKKIFSIILVLVTIFSVFGLSPKAEAAISRVQFVSGKTAGSSTSVSAIWSSTTTTGNLLVAIIGLRNSSTITPPTVTGNAWTLAGSRANGTNASNAIYYIKNASSQSGSSSWSITSSQATLHLIEYSGINAVNPLDVTINNTGTTSPTSSGTTATTSQANEVAISGINSSSGAAGAGATFKSTGTGWTEVFEIGATGGAQSSRTDGAFDEKILSTTGAQVETNTYSTTTNWASTIATFKEAPLAPGIPDMTTVTDTGSSSSDNITNNATPSFAVSCTTGTTVTLYDNVTSVGTGTCASSTVTITSSTLSYGSHTINAKQDGSAVSGNLSITIDTTAPTQTPITPITNATIHDTTSSISITNSEALASGSIVVTRTGGTADGTTHTCTLIGTGLSTGLHTINFADTTNGCVSVQTLVNGAIYSFAFNATDIAGNTATTVNNTGITFANAYTLTIPTSTGNGSGSYGGTSAGLVAYNTAVSITATPALSSNFTSWTATGSASSCNGSSVSPCAFNMTGDASVTAVYTLKTYTLTYTAGTNGTITGTTPQTVNYGANGTEVTAEALSGYHFTSWSDGVLTASRTDLNITANISVSASFAVNTYTLTYTAGTNGTITGTTPQTVNSGANGTEVTAVADSGYHFTSWSDGVLTASRTDTNITADINVTASFAFTEQPLDHFTVDTIGAQTSGAAFDIIITAKDSLGNTIPSFIGTVDLSTNAGTITPLISGSFIGGIRTENVSVTLSGLNKIITVTDHSGSGKTGTSNNFTVNPGVLNHFSIDTIPSQSESIPFDIVITARDINENAVTDFVGTVNLATNFGSVSPTVSGVFTGGIKVESITLSGSGVGRTITATRTSGSEAGTSNGFNVSSAVTQFVITDPTDNTVGNEVTVRVEAQDAGGVMITSYSNNVTLVASGSATGEGLVNIVDGFGTINISDNTAEIVGLSLTDTHGLLINTQDVVFSAGSLHHFIIDNISSSQIAGGDISITATAKDSFGNTVTSFDGTVNFSTTAGTITPSVSDNFVSGILTANVSVTLSGVGKTIEVTRTSGSENGTSNSFSVDPGVTKKFILNSPSDIMVGTRAGYTVTRRDQNNNLVTSGTDTVYLTTSSGITSKFYDAAIGGNEITQIDISDTKSVVNFWYFDDTAGSWTITTSDSDPANGDTGIIDSTDVIGVTTEPIVATRLIILDTTPTTAGETVSITVQAQDDLGRVDTSYNGSVNLLTSGPLPRPITETLSSGGIVSISSGEGLISIIDTKAETVGLSLNSPSPVLDVSTSKTIEFTPGAFNYFSMNEITSPQTAGSAIGLTITAHDINGNIATSFTGTVDLSTIAGTITPYISNNFSGGILNQNVLVTQSGVAKNITAKKTSDFQYITSNTFDVNPASVASFVVEANGGGDVTTKTINVPFDIQIVAKDSFGNIATSFNGTVNISSTGTLSSGGGITASFSNGVLSSHATSISNAGSFTLTATNTSGSETGISNSFSVSPLPIIATKFRILDPLNAQIGQNTTVTVEAVDDSGNRDDTYQGDIILVASGSATGAGLVDIINGVGTKVITDSVAETVVLTLIDTIPPTTNQLIFNTTTQNIIFSVAPPSGGGGGAVSAPVAPTISFSGRAFPKANIEIMAIKNGQVPIGNSSTGQVSGNFSLNYNGVLPPDVNTFAIVVYDKDKHIVQTKIFKLGISGELIQSILMAPNVTLNQQTVTKGAFMGIVGQAMPNYKVELMIDGVKALETGVSDSNGNYNLVFNTYHLGTGTHFLKVRQVDTSGKFSDYSIEKSFSIINSFIPKADLNNDGKVDVSDLSIFMNRYHLVDVNKHLELDLNNDGKVNISDLSLFLGALTK